MNAKTKEKYDSLPKLHSPSYIERVKLLGDIMCFYDCDRWEAISLLARSIGQSHSSTEKKFRDPSTNRPGNYTDCPAVIWARWMRIFNEALSF